MEKLTPQALFLSYALPAIDFCSGEKVTPQERQTLENVIKNNTRIQTSTIQKHFPDAISHIPIWTTKNILDYWLREHNEIEEGLYQTYVTRVGEEPRTYQNQNQKAIFEGKELIIPDYIKVNKGDIVSTHRFTIAQKLTPEMLAEYFPNFR